MALLLKISASNTYKNINNINLDIGLVEYRGVAKCHSIKEFEEISKIKSYIMPYLIFKAFIFNYDNQTMVIYGDVYISWINEEDYTFGFYTNKINILPNLGDK